MQLRKLLLKRDFTISSFQSFEAMMNFSRGQFNFTWLFAIIVGGMILFLAIFAALQFGDTQRNAVDSSIAKEINVLTNPLQVGFGEASYGSITFNKETRITNLCFEPAQDFGRNELAVATHSNIGEEWNKEGIATKIPNKYLFSEEQTVGKKYYILSKPFSLPYKVSDMLFMSSKDYCFRDSPDEILEELERLNVPNIFLEECSTDDSVQVCFVDGVDCDVKVFGTCNEPECDHLFETGKVLKGGGSLDYSGNLLYGAIFSDNDLYECEVERLLYRTNKITEILTQKIDLMGSRGCNSNLKSKLLIFSSILENASIEDLSPLYLFGKNLEEINSKEYCKTW
jgi:hypothetical protein